MAASLYEKYGGFAVISRIVMTFYDRMLDSDAIGPFFDDVEMKALMDHQTKFVAQVMGGPAAYSDSQLLQAHRRYDIANAHFDEMKKILDAALNEHGVIVEDRAIILAEIEARRALVVTTS